MPAVRDWEDYFDDDFCDEVRHDGREFDSDKQPSQRARRQKPKKQHDDGDNVDAR